MRKSLGGNPAVEINHFERIGPEWLVPKRTLYFWQTTGLWEGERESTYWCMPAILSSLFFLCCFPSFLSTYSYFLRFSPRDSYYRDCDPPPCAWQGPFFIVPVMTRFYHLAYNHLCLVWVYLPTTIGPSVLTVLLPITRQKRLFCLFVYHDTLTCYDVGVLSLYPSLHAPSGSNSSLLLLGSMSFQ